MMTKQWIHLCLTYYFYVCLSKSISIVLSLQLQWLSDPICLVALILSGI